MTSSTLALSALAALLLAACATAEPSADQTPTYDRVARPGSHLPVKDLAPMTAEEKEKQRQDARDTLSQSQRPVTR